MNVFEFFGLPEDHRKHPFQLVRKFVDVPKSKVKWPMIGQLKKDGVFAAFCFNKLSVRVFSRTGNEFVNTNKLILEFVNGMKGHNIYDNRIFIAEITNEEMYLEELSGTLNPNRNKPLSDEIIDKHEKTTMYFHDCLTYEEFLEGSSDKAYSTRYSFLEAATGCKKIPYMILSSEGQAERIFKDMVASDEEGIVLKQDVGYQSGHKGWRSMKMVRAISLDLECTGYVMGTVGTKREGMIAKLLFKWTDGKTIIPADLGKGWTDELRVDLTKRKDELAGNIFEIYAMKKSSKGLLRQPKVGEERHDKNEPDRV